MRSVSAMFLVSWIAAVVISSQPPAVRDRSHVRPWS
jgi:hypothetical protein